MDYGMVCLSGCLQVAHESQICYSTEPWLTGCTFVYQAENKSRFSILLIPSDPGLLLSAYPPHLQVSHASFLCVFVCSRCFIVSHILTITKTKPTILIESDLCLNHLDLCVTNETIRRSRTRISLQMWRGRFPRKALFASIATNGQACKHLCWMSVSVGFCHLETT